MLHIHIGFFACSNWIKQQWFDGICGCYFLYFDSADGDNMKIGSVVWHYSQGVSPLKLINFTSLIMINYVLRLYYWNIYIFYIFVNHWASIVRRKKIIWIKITLHNHSVVFIPFCVFMKNQRSQVVRLKFFGT